MVPEPILRALAEAIITASRQAVRLCRTGYKGPAREDAIGVQRWYKIQDNLAAALERLKAHFPMSSVNVYEFEGSSGHYVVFEAPGLRLNFIKTRTRRSNPTYRQRRASRPLQPKLWDLPDMLHATWVYGFEKPDPSTVAFMCVRFLNESFLYVKEQVDIVAEVLSKPLELPNIEPVEETPDIPLRPGKRIKKAERHKTNEG